MSILADKSRFYLSCLFCLRVIALLSFPLYVPAQLVVQPPASPHVHPLPIPTQQEVLLLAAGFSSDTPFLLMINNNRSAPLHVAVTAYTLDGSSHVLAAQDLVSRESRLIDLQPILLTEGLANREIGYLKLDYMGILMEMGAQLTLYRTATTSGFDSPRSLSVDFKTSKRSAAFIAPAQASVRLALTNASKSPIKTSIACNGFTDLVDLAPSQTSIRTLPNPVIIGPRAYGCDISYDGLPDALRAFGVISRQNYSAPIRFYDPATATSANLTAVAIKPSYETRVAVHNTLDLPVLIKPVLRSSELHAPHEWRLPPMLLIPRETNSIDLAETLKEIDGNSVPLANLSIETDASSGSLVGSLTQTDTFGTVEDVPLRTSNPARYDRGSYPLRWSEDYTNQVSIVNTANKPLGYRALITAGSTVYVLPKVTLEPNATMVFDVDAIRQSGIPDVNGLKLPPDATYGKFLWSELSDGKNSGLLGRTSLASQINRRRSSFSCGESCAFVQDEYPFFNFPAHLNYGASYSAPMTELYSSVNQPLTSYPYSSQSFFVSREGHFVNSGETDVMSVAADPSNPNALLFTGIGVGATDFIYLVDNFYETNDFAADSGCDDHYDYYYQDDHGEVLPKVMINSGSPSTITAGAVDSSSNPLQYMFTATGDPSGGTYSWSASGSSLNLTNSSSATVSAVGVSSSTPTLTAAYSLNGESASPSATKNVTVLKANSILVVDDSIGSIGCGTVPSAPVREITYQIKSSGTTITDPILIRENFTSVTNSCGGTVNQTTTAVSSMSLTPGNGHDFADFFGVCPVSTTQDCTITYVGQQWQQKNADGSYTSIGTVGNSTANSTTGATIAGHSPSQDLTGTTFQ